MKLTYKQLSEKYKDHPNNMLLANSGSKTRVWFYSSPSKLDRGWIFFKKYSMGFGQSRQNI